MKKTFVLLISVLISHSLFSQQIRVTQDFGLWSGVNIEKKLTEDFEINLEQQLRFYSNVSEFDDYLIELGGKYKMNKNFKLGSNIRYTYNARRRKDSENNYRYNLDLLYKGDLSKSLSIHYRLRYQHEYVNAFSEDQPTNINSSDLRNRVKIKYDINETHKGCISAELFRIREQFREPYFNRVRFYIGDEIRSKLGEFSVSFGYEQEINHTYPLSFFFFKTIYTLKL